MIIKRNRPGKFGTFFAIWPRWTPDGWVAFERINWERIESWGWGSGDEYRYSRRAPKAYEFYATPPDPKSNCKNFRPDGPTPCYYPNCDCVKS